MEISKELVEELGNKIKKLEDRRGKFNTVFYAVAGEQLGSCKKLNLPIISDMNLSGDSAEKTFCFAFDTYVLLSGDGGKVTNPNSVDVGNLLGLGSVSLCGVEEALQTLFGDVEIESETFKKDNGEVSKAEEENSKDEEDNEDEVKDTNLDNSSLMYLSFINNKVDDLIESYSALYKVCYENSRPKGVLTPEGIYTLSGTLMSVDDESRAELSTVYRVIEECLGKLDGVSRFNSKVSPTKLEETSGKPLYINYHLANMYGYFGGRSKKSTSFSEFISYIKSRTIKVLKNIVNTLPEDVKEKNREEVEGIILQYIANLKNCILVDDYQPGVVLKLRICVDSAVYPQEYNTLKEDAFRNVIEQGYLFKRKAEVSSPSRDHDVIYMNFVVDAQSYYNAPLFAYEALPVLQDQGISLSWNNILIGKNTKDEYVFGKFGAEQKTMYNILAGSGSGKGVMTLNLLASALASNMPVIYGDCKPDMSRVLWDVAGGRNVLAIDGDSQGILEAIEGKYNIYQYYNTVVPDPLREYINGKGLGHTFVKTFSYIKTIQLSYLISCLRAGKVSSDDYILFIFDEIGRLAEQVKDLTVAIKGEDGEEKAGFIAEYTAKLKAEGVDQKQIKLDPVLKYARDYIQYFVDVINNLSRAKTAELRKSNSKYLFIWQPDWLSRANVAMISSTKNKYYFMSLIYKMVADSNTVKFAGKGAEKSGVLGTDPIYDDSNRDLFDEYRYFAMSESGDFSGKTEIFRPFLLLNDSSEDSAAKCVGTNPLAREKVYANGNSGEVIPEIGFPSYVNKLLGGNVQDPLCRSWDLAEKALKEYGYDPDVFKFLYDVSDFSLSNSDNLENLDSTQKDGNNPSELSYSDMLKNNSSSREEDFSNEEDTLRDEDERLRKVFNEDIPQKGIEISDDDPMDMYGDSMLNEASLSDTDVLTNEEFHENVREAEQLLNRLKELGINIPLGNSNNIERVNNRSTIDLGSNYNYEDYATTYEDLIRVITEDVINKFGGLNRFKSFTLNGGSIGVNNTYYRCKIKSKQAENVPYDIKRQINSGCVYSLFNYSMLWQMPNLREITVDSMSTFRDYIKPLYKGDIEAIFGTIKTLETLTIGTDVIERSNLDASVLNKKLFDSERNESIGSTIQGVLFKGTAKSANLMKNSFTSNKKWYLKALGVTTGGVGVIATGSMGVATGITRGIASGIKGFGNGLKELFK